MATTNKTHSQRSQSNEYIKKLYSTTCVHSLRGKSINLILYGFMEKFQTYNNDGIVYMYHIVILCLLTHEDMHEFMYENHHHHNNILEKMWEMKFNKFSKT